MQKILKPSNYGAIDIWMRNHGTKDKRGMVLLGEAAVGDNGVPVHQDSAYKALQQTVKLNPKGRHRVDDAIHVTADRAQADLLRIRCKEDQSDKELVRRRKFVSDFAPVPSTDSVSEFYRLGDVPISSEAGAKVLTEDARRGLTRWQIRGPERNREETAQICKALRSLGGAVDGIPQYTDEMRNRRTGGQGCSSCLHDYGEVKRASRNGSYIRRLPRTQPGEGLSRSMPTIPPAYISTEELAAVKRGGFSVTVGLNDCEPLQYMKNIQRNKFTKIVNGGATSYSTAYNEMSAAIAR